MSYQSTNVRVKMGGESPQDGIEVLKQMRQLPLLKKMNSAMLISKLSEKAKFRY
jgi:hypothetical protein